MISKEKKISRNKSSKEVVKNSNKLSFKIQNNRGKKIVVYVIDKIELLYDEYRKTFLINNVLQDNIIYTKKLEPVFISSIEDVFMFNKLKEMGNFLLGEYVPKEILYKNNFYDIFIITLDEYDKFIHHSSFRRSKMDTILR